MKLYIYALSAVLALSLASCTKRNDESVGQKVLNLAEVDDAKSLDPAIAYDAVSLPIMTLAMESLYQYKYTKVPLELEPLTAEGMPTVSKDMKTYTIKIKKGIMWQDDPAFPGGKGRELVASDYLYAWKRLLVPMIKSPGTWIFDEKVVGWEEYKKYLQDNRDNLEEVLQKDVAGLKALDSHTIQIQLVKPYPQLVHALAMGFGAPLAKEVAQKYGHEGLNAKMVGTGPYQLSEYVKGSRVVLVKNPTFRQEAYPTEGDADAQAAGIMGAAGKKLPFLDKIVFNIIKEDQPRWLQLMKGNLDADLIPKDSFDSAVENGALKADIASKGIKLQKVEAATIWYLNFNMKDKIVGGNNADLRRAISMAINREDWIKTFTNNRGIKATSLVPRIIAGHTGRKELVNDYNLEKAKEYLAKAGYPGGKGLPVIKYDLRNGNTTSRQVAEFIKKSLEVIGVNIEIVVNTFPAFLEKEKTGNLQFFAGGWIADYPDADNFLFLLYSKNAAPGPNASNYSNPAYDKIYERMATMMPSKARDELIKKAEDIAFGDAVWSMLYYPVVYNIYHDWLLNFRPNELISNRFKYLDIDTEKRVKEKAKL